MFKNTRCAKIVKEKRGGIKKMVRGVSKKGAMELSMNTIVVVVIGITLLVLGLVFVRGIFTRLGGMGEEAFRAGEQELKQMQTGETKINFPASINIKPGKSTNPALRICNTDGVIDGKSVYLIMEGSDIYKGLKINIGSDILKGNCAKKATDCAKISKTKSLGQIDWQNCYPLPVLISTEPSVEVDPNKQPFLTLTVRSESATGPIYDSIGTTITV